MTRLLDVKPNINVPISSWTGVIFTRSNFRIWCEMVASQGSNYFYAIIFFISLFMHNRQILFYIFKDVQHEIVLTVASIKTWK